MISLFSGWLPFLGLRCWYYDNIAQVWLRLGTSAQVSNVAHGYIIIFKNSFSMFRTSKIKIILFFFKPLQGLSPVVFYNKSNVAFGARFFMLNFGFNFVYTRLPYLYKTHSMLFKEICKDILIADLIQEMEQWCDNVLKLCDIN